ncbi:hypothetical protein C8F01DRAFT_1156099, partial [Mycena amicta]
MHGWIIARLRAGRFHRLQDLPAPSLFKLGYYDDGGTVLPSSHIRHCQKQPLDSTFPRSPPMDGVDVLRWILSLQGVPECLLLTEERHPFPLPTNHLRRKTFQQHTTPTCSVDAPPDWTRLPSTTDRIGRATQRDPTETTKATNRALQEEYFVLFA